MLIKSSLLILSGSIIAQVLHMVSIPVLSRLFNPTEIGQFQILVAAMTTILPISTMKYEFAILKVKRHRHMSLLLVGCAVLSLVVASFVPFGARVLEAIGWKLSGIWTSPLIFAMLLGGGLFQTTWQVAVRESRHRSIAISKPFQSLVFNLTALIGAVWGGASVLLLVAADVFSRLVASAVVLRADDLRHGNIFQKRKAVVLWHLVKRYKAYPIYSVPSGVVGAFAASLPVFWLGAVFSEEMAGQFSMAWRSVVMPVSLLSLAINQVVTGRISTMVRENDTELAGFLLRVSLGGTSLFALPILSLLLWGDSALVFVLGPNWEIAGRMLLALVPLLISNFIGGPIGMALVVIGRTDIQLAWDIARLALISISLAVSYALSLSSVETVFAYSMAMFVASIVFLAVSTVTAKRNFREKRSLP